MENSTTLKSTQEQAVASWIDYLNQLRAAELIANLAKQSISLEKALGELQKLKDFVADPEHILGSMLSKHGEIAEHTQVNISNARRIVEGLKGEYTFLGVGRTAQEDYLHNGIPVQAKFVQVNLSLNAIKDHLAKYPDFLESGGKYQIPKDFYERMRHLSSISSEDAGKLRNIDYKQWKMIQSFFEETGVAPEKIEPTVVDYHAVQIGKIGETISNEESVLKNTDSKRREQHINASKPSLQEGVITTAAAAAIEGGMNFCLSIAMKLKGGKRLCEFSVQDWNDVGIDTAKGAGKGGIRGASIYVLTNFTHTPAPIASAMVTASFGMVSQAVLLRQGKINNEQFILNSEVLCLDASVSAVASLIGQVTIPIPVLGAVIGNAVGMFMYGIARDDLSNQEQELILAYIEQMETLNKNLDEEYRVVFELLDAEFGDFKTVADLAFNFDINKAFAGSIALADFIGCPDKLILKNKADIDSYFLE